MSKIQNISLFLNKPSGSPPKNILSNWKNWITQNSFTFCMGLRNKKHHHASAQISFWTIRQPFWISTRKFRVKKRAYLWKSWRPNKGRKDLNIHTSLGGFCVWGRRLAVVLLVDELEQKVGLVRLKVSWDMTHRPIAFEDTILVIATVFARENSKVLQFFHTKELKWYSLKTSRMKKRWKTLIFGSGLERDIRKI